MKNTVVFVLLIYSIQINCILTPRLARNPAQSSVTTVPKYLFHWRASQNTKPEPHQLLKEVKSKYGIVQQWPDLHLDNKEALFTWSHPTGGMRFSSNNEFYAGDLNDSNPELIVLSIDPKSSVLKLESIFQEFGKLNSSIQLDQFDFIFHKVFNKDKSLRYQEWIILNPKKILSATSDPALYPTEVISELHLSLMSGYKLVEDSKIAPRNEFGEYERFKINQLLAIKQNQCKKLFE